MGKYEKHRQILPNEREGVIEKLRGALKAHQEVSFAYLFGSFTEGLPFHDIDVGVYVKELQPSRATEYALDLAGSITKALGLPVDVRVLNFASITFTYHALRGKRLVNRDPDLHDSVVEDVVSRYLDIAPLLRMATKEAFVQ